MRKFRNYTKLKYSRTPAVDVAASAIAAFLAGLIGFLLAEKAGFELLDSGDLFYFYLYLILIYLIFHPYIFILHRLYEYDFEKINFQLL